MLVHSSRLPRPSGWQWAVLAVTLVLASVVIWAIWRDARSQATRHVVLDTKVEKSPHTHVAFSVDSIRYSDATLTGTLTVLIVPFLETPRLADTVSVSDTLSLTQTAFIVRRPPSDTRFEILGDSFVPILLTRKPLRAELIASSKIAWGLQDDPSVFWYPFDRYTLQVDPQLLRPQLGGWWETMRLNQFYLDLSGQNLRFHAPIQQSSDINQNQYIFQLERPAVLRAIVLIAAMLSVIWLVFLATAADPKETIGSIVTFFLGVFALRSTLLGTVTVFPTLIDYASLALYTTAITIILVRWLWIQGQTNNRSCPFCQSSIHPNALRCPHCTAKLS
jgi:hypothetical protein